MAVYGGAMYLYISSTFSILPHTTVCWKNNHASLGGTIYVSNYNPLIYCTQIATFIATTKECFFQIFTVNLLPGIQLVFKNNSADITGSVLYGGKIDKCKLDWKYHKSGKVYDMLVQYEADATSLTHLVYACVKTTIQNAVRKKETATSLPWRKRFKFQLFLQDREME